MDKKNLVWYVGYGSNVERERFLCYIKGGTPVGSSKNYTGARDTTDPRADEKITIDNQLYFAKSSGNWNEGGVGFVKIEPSLSTITYARRYLVTREQFEDIAKQETSSDEVLPINFEEAITKGSSIFKLRSWYGKVLFLGMKNNCPLLTLTNENNLTATTKPDPTYLITIMKGLSQTFKLNQDELTTYFLNKPGVAGNYSKNEMLNITKLALGIQ